MEVLFEDARLEECCRSEREMRRRFGEAGAKKLQLRLKHLRAAGTLEDMRSFPGGFHKLKGDRRGQLALALDGGFRLVIRPAESGPGRRGTLNWAAVTVVVVVEIVDYHK